MDLTFLIALHIIGILALLYFKKKQTQATEDALNHPDDKELRSLYQFIVKPE